MFFNILELKSNNGRHLFGFSSPVKRQSQANPEMRSQNSRYDANPKTDFSENVSDRMSNLVEDAM